MSLLGFAQSVDDTYGRDWKLPKSPKWEALKQKEIPEWMIDAKFGMYTHWGIYSVPAHGGPDYIKELYAANGEDRKGVKKYHEAKYGKIEDFGYKILYQCLRLKNLMLKSGWM